MPASTCLQDRKIRSRSLRRRKRRTARKGAIITIEMIVALPIVVAFALTILQFMLIGSAHYRVQAAAVAAAETAAAGGNSKEVHDSAGKMLGPHLRRLYQTEMEYTIGKDPRHAEHNEDSVIVSVRIPMLAASRNFLGLFGGDISPLHIRAVAEKKISKPGGFRLR
ncbi:MAG: hypothetical protein MPJ50_15970 [Pirellulales bacterium]|nr:hypothetical protein [Pirellulales bacterium]